MIDSEVYRMSFLRKIKSLGVKAFVGGELSAGAEDRRQDV